MGRCPVPELIEAGVKTVDEATLLAAAARETEIMIERSGLESLLDTPEGFWGNAMYPDRS
jgi:hypothetical protein